jgi:hypothetical protein
MDNANTGNPNAVELTGSTFPRDGFLGSIEVDPDDENFIIVSFSNYNVISVFATSDGGTTWEQVSGNLEANNDGSGYGPSVRCIRLIKNNNQNVYFAATSVGLFSTTKLDGDQTVWYQEGVATIGNVIVDNIDTRNTDGLIVIGTQGNGVYRGLYTPISISEKGNSSGLILEQNYPNPAKEQTTISFNIPEKGHVNLHVFDINGRLLMNPLNTTMDKGYHSVKINTHNLPNGTYFYRMVYMNKAITKKIVIQKF